MGHEKALIRNLFVGSHFTGFSFDTCFILKFNRSDEIDIKDCKFGGDFKITVLSELWFGEKRNWTDEIKKFPEIDCADGYEPISAYYLSCLRWSDGAEIFDVLFEKDVMKLIFINGTVISVVNNDGIDHSWIICETNTKHNRYSWEIICDDNEFYVNFIKGGL